MTDKKRPTKQSSAGKADGPVLLSGGNPQIPKGYGEAPVKAYVDAVPGWKQEIVRRLDELVTKAVPGVRKAVKWNSPLFGAPGGPDDTWFMSLHCFDRYVKVAFFRGAELTPLPPGKSKHPLVRYLDIRQDDPFDEAQIAAWMKQASKLPGEKM